MSRFLTPFSGSSSATTFIRDFNSYCIIEKITEDKRKIASFSLYLKGPARGWFDDLDWDNDVELKKWATIEERFIDQYINSNSNFYTETQLFESLKLHDSQKVDDFYSLLQEKARTLEKTDKELMMKFIYGLPDKLAYFVRASNPHTSQEALTQAKNIEAFGYSTHTTPSHTASATVAVLRQQIKNQQDTIKDMQINIPHVSAATPRCSPGDGNQRRLIPQASNDNKQQRLAPTRRSTGLHCYKCLAEGHLQRQCNKIPEGRSRPDLQCQICNQFGHGAKFCTRFPQQRPLFR